MILMRRKVADFISACEMEKVFYEFLWKATAWAILQMQKQVSTLQHNDTTAWVYLPFWGVSQNDTHTHTLIIIIICS